ncbi:thioesterase II family protein [Pseudonocardia sp. MH-G8]|uniref:thioesterase II family protein n=1 Tax=Pseudonocardia sp. MH-G8 TaxID=1854588 RepID=UPI000BA0BB56|nr:alpha/beta fold hydrolase [Pseudonocardia sp. MH-G8]OZM83062.1 thioesterase [Pseudonocardia sp. MH-G8]
MHAARRDDPECVRQRAAEEGEVVVTLRVTASSVGDTRDAPGAESLWIRQFRRSLDPAVRLVCFPHAGGSAGFFHPMAHALNPSIEVLAVQYPGRQDRLKEPGVTDIGELADRVVEALGERLDRPLALFGHSMGATVAFEVAVRLEAAGVVARVLFISGRRAPSVVRHEEVHLRSDDELVAELAALHGTEPALLRDEGLLQMILPAIRSDYRAIETYRCRPGSRTSSPVLAFTGESDPKVDLDEVHAWGRHTSSTFELATFPGGHFFLTVHLPAIVAAIEGRLGSTS